MPARDLIVIGASAGGIEALATLVAALPADLPAALFVVVHIAPSAVSTLPAILARHGELAARHPVDDEPIRPGTIYVAPPDHHLLVRPGRVRLTRGPRENGHRPAVDPLFRSAALHYGSRVIGVVLSGNLDDGSAGLAAVKARGGVALVQDPNEASFPSMPRRAAENVAVDGCLPVAELAAEIVRWVGAAVPLGRTASEDMRIETDQLESALWAALRALDEERSLAERLAARARERGSGVVGRFEERARDAAVRSDLIRSVLISGQTGQDRPLRPGNGRRRRSADAALQRSRRS